MLKSCEKAMVICSKSQYREARLTEKIYLRIHLLTCKFCRAFNKENNKLTQLCSKVIKENLHLEEKVEMKQVLSKEIQK